MNLGNLNKNGFKLCAFASWREIVFLLLFIIRIGISTLHETQSPHHAPGFP